MNKLIALAAALLVVLYVVPFAVKSGILITKLIIGLGVALLVYAVIKLIR